MTEVVPVATEAACCTSRGGRGGGGDLPDMASPRWSPRWKKSLPREAGRPACLVGVADCGARKHVVGERAALDRKRQSAGRGALRGARCARRPPPPPPPSRNMPGWSPAGAADLGLQHGCSLPGFQSHLGSPVHSIFAHESLKFPCPESCELTTNVPAGGRTDGRTYAATTSLLKSNCCLQCKDMIINTGLLNRKVVIDQRMNKE